MNLQLVEAYIDRLKDLLAKADVSVVPADVAKIDGFFTGFDQVAGTIITAKEVSHERCKRHFCDADLGRDLPRPHCEVFQSIRLVSTQTAHIVERLGKYHKTQTGFHALIPL